MPNIETLFKTYGLVDEVSRGQSSLVDAIKSISELSLDQVEHELRMWNQINFSFRMVPAIALVADIVPQGWYHLRTALLNRQTQLSQCLIN